MDEQVLLLAVGGELDTAFVLPRIFSDDYPAPSVSADAFHVIFPDDAVIEYEPETSALADSSIKIANITASQTLITSCQRYGLEHQPALLSTRPK
ncbi:baseplate assembly protein V [Yersinia frederiksenii]|nr:baseplate assembly protein V [Yersinia frederiksenii]CNF55524.1 baseplate assembly protein V [Yersinia frederiksenii]CQI92593.1 baseplate assembly protein V [Yersinia frederiksenii]